MTLVLCVNTTGSDRLPVWIIGPEGKPSTMRELDTGASGATWHFSKNPSMTYLAMQEWLLYFYSHIGKKRSIILLLDNLGAHRKGVKLAPPLSNIRIQWLPPKCTSLYQPLDQGIIRTFRSHYQRIWLKYMIQKMYGDFANPLHTISPELAVYWILQIWQHHITCETIHTCFQKSGIIQPKRSSLTSERLSDPSLSYKQAQQSREAVDIGV